MFNIMKKHDDDDSYCRRVNGLRADLQSGRIKDATKLKHLSSAIDKISVDIQKLRTIDDTHQIDEYVSTAFEIDECLSILNEKINGTLRQRFERAVDEAIADGSYKDPFAEK